MRSALLLLLLNINCTRPAPVPVIADVPVAAVSAPPPPPAPPQRLPSSLKQRRPLTERECRVFIRNMIERQVAEGGADDPQMRRDRVEAMLQSLGSEIEGCHGVLVTEREAACMAKADDIARCREED